MIQGRRSMSRAARSAQMRELVARYEASGESQIGFCRAHRLPLSTFQYWRRRATAQDDGPRATPSFVELQVVGRATATEGLDLTLPGGAVVKILANTPEDLIRRVLRAAGASC